MLVHRPHLGQGKAYQESTSLSSLNATGSLNTSIHSRAVYLRAIMHNMNYLVADVPENPSRGPNWVRSVARFALIFAIS